LALAALALMTATRVEVPTTTLCSRGACEYRHLISSANIFLSLLNAYRQIFNEFSNSLVRDVSVPLMFLNFRVWFEFYLSPNLYPCFYPWARSSSKDVRSLLGSSRAQLKSYALQTTYEVHGLCLRATVINLFVRSKADSQKSLWFILTFISKISLSQIRAFYVIQLHEWLSFFFM